MEAKRGQRSASQRDYTPHEHEELLAIASKAHQRPQLATTPNWAKGSPPVHGLSPRNV